MTIYVGSQSTNVYKGSTQISNAYYGSQAVSKVDNGFSPIMQKLSSGQDAVLFVNGDSTAWPDYGPFYKLGTLIGQYHNCNVVLYRWAEWTGTDASGPKEYWGPYTLNTGTGPTLTIGLGAIPGQVPGALFDGSRRTNAIDGFPLVPDAVLFHHGHNMLTTLITNPAQYSVQQRGAYWGPIGMTSLKWPNVPIIMTTQNPRRDDNGYDTAYNNILKLKQVMPSITVVDTHAAFIAQGKAPILYQDVTHPSATIDNSAGATLTANTIFNAYKQSKANTYSTPSWPNLTGTNLLPNGDFSNWTGSAPAGWTLFGTTTVAKDTTYTYGGAAYSMAVSPNSNMDNRISITFDSTLNNALAGKTFSVAALVRQPSTQTRAYISANVRSGGAAVGYAAGDWYNCWDGWMWLVLPGIQADADFASYQNLIRIYPSFGTSPTANDPLIVQKVVVTLDEPPKGLL